MTNGQPPAPPKGMNPALKWILIGCGGIFVLALLAASAIGYFVYHKAKEAQAELAAKGIHIDATHGVKGMAYGMTVALARGMEPGVLVALPKAEHPQADKAFRDLAAKGSDFTDQDMRDLNAAITAYNVATKAKADAGHPPLDEDAARTFVKDLQAIADRH